MVAEPNLGIFSTARRSRLTWSKERVRDVYRTDGAEQPNDPPWRSPSPRRDKADPVPAVQATTNPRGDDMSICAVANHPTAGREALGRILAAVAHPERPAMTLVAS